MMVIAAARGLPDGDVGRRSWICGHPGTAGGQDHLVRASAIAGRRLHLPLTASPET